MDHSRHLCGGLCLLVEGRLASRFGMSAWGETLDDWRLCSRIVSIGELMVALGGQYTARDIDLLWQSMIIAAEKRQVKEHRNKKGERSRQ